MTRSKNMLQRYSICVRQEEGFCCVLYSVCQDQMAPLGGAATDATSGFSFDTTPAAKMALTDDACNSLMNTVDYIAIPESGMLYRLQYINPNGF